MDSRALMRAGEEMSVKKTSRSEERRTAGAAGCVRASRSTCSASSRHEVKGGGEHRDSRPQLEVVHAARARAARRSPAPLPSGG